MLKRRHIGFLLVFGLITVSNVYAQSGRDEQAFANIRSMLKVQPFDAVRDSLVESTIVDILDKSAWRESELYVLGSQILEKDPENFAAYYIRGWYLSHTATDKMGYHRALDELLLADKHWDTDRYVPHRGSLDALLSLQAANGIGDRARTVSYMLTYYYLQLQYEISSVYLELDMAAESYNVMKKLRDKNFAYDFYSLTRIAWIFYKYRDAAETKGLSFLRPNGMENIALAIRFAKEEQSEIAEYKSAKYQYPRYWVDNSTSTWYENAANNIISIAYGVGWETDSAITYYEKMPEWFKLRLNGTYLYLADINYRAAERQFEYAGKAGGRPVAVLSEPEALESYKNILIYKGALDEAHFYLDDYAQKYQLWRGMGILWQGTVNYWNGNLDEAERLLKQAYDYPEVFGNTSFTKLHYNMQIHIQLSAVHTAKLHRLEFEPLLESVWYENLWLSVKNFFLKLYHGLMAYLHEYWAVDSYLQIVDRYEYIKPFYTENPADYFQTWSILRNLNPEWHLKKIAKAKADDERLRSKKFYDLFKAGFQLEQGNNTGALSAIAGNGLLAKADTTYEKLFIAMAEDMTVEAIGGGSGTDEHILNMYRWYPQAVYLWGHTLPLRLEFNKSLAVNEQTAEYLEDVHDVLRKFSFDFRESGNDVPVLTVIPEMNGGELAMKFTVAFDGQVRNSGTVKVGFRKNGEPRYLPGYAAKQLAYSVFSIRFHTEEKNDASTIARGS